MAQSRPLSSIKLVPAFLKKRHCHHASTWVWGLGFRVQGWNEEYVLKEAGVFDTWANRSGLMGLALTGFGIYALGF